MEKDDAWLLADHVLVDRDDVDVGGAQRLEHPLYFGLDHGDGAQERPCRRTRCSFGNFCRPRTRYVSARMMREAATRLQYTASPLRLRLYRPG